MKRLAALAMVCTPWATMAADAPLIHPLRDVDVTYKVPVRNAGGAMLLQRLRWSAALRRQRVDLPTTGTWIVLDYQSGRMLTVRDDVREAISAPAPANALQAGAGAGYSRAGQADVAGLACTNWRSIDLGGQESVACYTTDGVLLRAVAGDTVLMEAIRVTYTTQEPAVFDAPADYVRNAAKE